MASNITLEIAANSFQSCIAAQSGGADRIELFENLPEGGCTPSYGMLKQVVSKISLPVFVMIRPRGGDFVYGEDEYNIMLHDIELCRQMGFQGIVAGILLENGAIDVERCKELKQVAGSMKITYHRAIDRTSDMHRGIKQLIRLGYDRILTSGGAINVDEGVDTIRELQREYGNDIIIMPGCGIRPGNVAAIVRGCGVHEVHATAKREVKSGMSNPKPYFTDTRQESDLRIIKELRQELNAV